MVLKEIFGIYSTTNYPSSILFCNDVYFTEISFILSFCLMQMPCFLFPSNVGQYHHSIIQAAINRRKNLQNEEHLTWLFKDLIKFLFSLQLPSYFGDDQSSNKNQHCFSEKYIISIMLNHPYIIEEVIEFLIREFASQSLYLPRLESILKQVSLFSRVIAEKVRFYCMKFKKFSDLCLGITFDCVKDYCSFFNNCFNVVLESGANNIFTDSKPSESCLFDCIKQNTKTQAIIRELIISELQREDLSVSETCSLMRLCSALMLLSNFNVFRNDFSMVINTNPNIPVSIHLTKLRFSFLFICGENLTASLSSDLMVVDNSSNSNIVSILRDFIKFLMDVANSMHTEGGTSHFDKIIIKNILLLLATNFHAELYKSISTFVLDTLHPVYRNSKHSGHGSFNTSTSNQGSQTGGETIVHSYKPSRYLLDENTLKRQLGDKISQLFISELFPVEKLAKDILTVTPLPFYTSDNDYVLQCVFRMLKSKLFRKHSVDASDWVFEQLENIQSVDNPRSTLHHLIPKIIDELISNCTPHPTIIFEMRLFKEEKVAKIFENPKSNQVSRALLLYYILSVNNIFKKQRYGPNIIEKCNVVEVVKYIKEHRRQVKVFYSQLLSVVEELQYLFHLETLLSESVIHYETRENVHITSVVIEEIILTPMKDQNKTKMVLDDLRNDKQISQKLEDQILFMLDVSNHNGLLYNFQNVRHFVFNAFKEWWKWMFSKTNPMSLALKTAQVLLPKEYNPSQMSYINFYENILILFKVDQRVFMCPPLLDIFLQVLSLFMTASSKYVTQVVPNEAVLKDSFSKVQESTILQLLLEYLNPNLFSKDNSSIHEDNGSTDMRIIQRKICQFIHQRFIENPPISKLIHFQTYNPALLPITVSLIDSIHICMDFINELLNQPKINQQMFAVQLASFICEKYPLQRYIDVARSAIAKLKLIANQRSVLIANNMSSPEGSIDLFTSKHSANQQEELSNAKEILDTLLRLSRAFPFLCLECIQVVHELKTVFVGKPKVLNLVQQYFVKLTNTSANI